MAIPESEFCIDFKPDYVHGPSLMAGVKCIREEVEVTEDYMKRMFYKVMSASKEEMTDHTVVLHFPAFGRSDLIRFSEGAVPSLIRLIAQQNRQRFKIYFRKLDVSARDFELMAELAPSAPIDRISVICFTNLRNDHMPDECVEPIKRLMLNMEDRFDYAFSGPGIRRSAFVQSLAVGQDIVRHNQKLKTMTLAQRCHKSLCDAGMERDFFMKAPRIVVYNMTMDVRREKRQRLF